MLCRLLVCVCVVLLGCVWTASNSPAADPATLAVEAAGWAVQEETGRVFATVKNQNEVVEYSSQGGKVRSIAVAGDPTELIIKRDLLVVACTKSPSLVLIDLARNEIAGSVQLPGTGPYALFCSQADNPYVYAICKTGSAWWDGEVFQVDTQALEIRAQQQVQPWRQSHPIHVAMSRDGNWIVVDARGKSTPSGGDLMKVDEEAFTFTQVRGHHESFGQIVPGPRNRYWTLGNLLYPLDITEQVRAFGGTPVAIHPTFDLAASLKGNELHLERFSDASEIATVVLDNVDLSDKTDKTIRFDLPNNLVIVGTHASVHWVDLEDHADQLAPLRMLDVPSEVTSLVGQPLRIELAVSNADVESKTHIAIARGPQAARIDGDALVWTPTAEDVGFQTIVLEAKQADGTVVDSAELTVHTTLPTLEFDFPPKSMALSPDGKRMLVWGPAPGQEERHPAHTGPDALVVIDVDKLDVVVRKTLPQGIRCAAIDNRWIYLAPNSGNLFYRLDHELTSNERQFLKSTPTRLIKISEDRLAVVGDQTEGFEVNPLKSHPIAGLANFNRHIQAPIAWTSHDTIRIANRVVEYDSGKLVRSVTSALPVLAGTVNRLPHNPHQRNQSVERWGRIVAGPTLMNHAGNRIAQWSGPRLSTISERWPVAVTVRTTPNSTARTTETWFELHDLVDGTVLQSALIAVAPTQSASRTNRYGSQQRLITDAERVFVLNEDELVVATIPEAIGEKATMPTYFTERQPTEIAVAGEQTVQLGVGGSSEGVTFSLMAEYEGIAIDSSSGELTIDTTALWDRFVAGPSAQTLPHTSARDRDPFDVSANASEYKNLTGKSLPADQFAAQLPISAALRESDGQEDATQFSLIVLGPRAPIDARREQQRKRQEQQRAEAAARREQARRQAETAKQYTEALARAENARQPAGDEERLDRIEARIRRIEAALDSILKELEKK
ncbi:YncE family protein [Roseimaritima sediminicola]|uniref:hypothetical protein n=1 Tax=Roseimaritima sediminicola TaxID=2662066 RepID=UPI001298393B|nr:hypothetical protein [Roseimaritima sediminicola]